MSPFPVRRGSWKIHKRLSEPDRWLDEMGFFRKHTARDASCLFRIISENIYNTQKYFHQVRMDCIEFMASERHLFEGSLNCPFESYLKGMSNPSEWGGFVEISAMSHLYRRDFVIFEVNKCPQTKISNGYGHTIYLFYSPDTKHFDAVYTKEYISTSSFCQSLVYDLLYDGVFQIKDLSYAIDKMLHDKIPTNHVEYFMSENVERRKKQKEKAKIFIEATSDDKDKNNNVFALKCKHHTKDVEHASILKESLSIFILNRSLVQLDNICLNCLNMNSAKDLLDNGITPFPYKVAKALDPDIYRNIEFDVWSEMRREMRYAGRYSDGKTLQVGVKCLCKLQPDQVVPYHCHIQEMSPDSGPCLVFIEELGEKCIVNFNQLEPLPSDEVRPWAPPYRYSRSHSNLITLSQMLQQIGNITRKQVLNKSRSKTKNNCDDIKNPEKMNGNKQIERWNGEKIRNIQRYIPSNIDFHQHLDFFNFYTVPVEVETLPAMVDCRGGSGAASGDSSPATNGASQEHNIQPRYTGNSSNEMAPPTTSAAPPATTQPTTTTSSYGNYSGNHHQHQTSRPYTSNSMTTMGAGGVGTVTGYGGCTYVPYTYRPGGVVWYAPNSPPPSLPPHAVAPIYKPNGPEMMNGDGRMHNGIASPPSQMPPAPYSQYAPPPPPPGMACPPMALGAHLPPGVNSFVYKSMQPNGADLPFNDIMTLRFFFNLGLDCFHGHHWNPQRHLSRDIAQEMQQMSLYDRSNNGEHKHGKPGDKNNNQGKGNGQRPLVGPRFKRTNNQEGQNNNHHQYNRHNNATRGLNNNNRRNSSQSDTWSVHGGVPMGAPAGAFSAEGEQPPLGVEQAPVHYVHYPPPMYQIPAYYSIDQDPSVMMMGGVNYVNYMNEEGVEYPSMAPLQYYAPPPSYPPPANYAPAGHVPAGHAPAGHNLAVHAPAAGANTPTTPTASAPAPNTAQNQHSDNK